MQYLPVLGYVAGLVLMVVTEAVGRVALPDGVLEVLVHVEQAGGVRHLQEQGCGDAGIWSMEGETFDLEKNVASGNACSHMKSQIRSINPLIRIIGQGNSRNLRKTLLICYLRIQQHRMANG